MVIGVLAVQGAFAEHEQMLARLGAESREIRQKKDLEGIFNRFFRSDTVRGKNIDGHGLGLSIARLIVDGHAGKISVRTQYTKGSCFTITLPYERGV